MHRSIRRGFVAAAALAAVVLSVPGAGQAASQCGVVVCAEAIAVASWDCTTVDDVAPGFDYIECRGTARPEAWGYSSAAIPGSMSWSATTQSGYSFDGGMTWTTYPGSTTPISTCTWAGLGENRCGNVGNEGSNGSGGWIPWGSCLDTYYNFDLEISVSVTATATKSLLVLGPVDTATATETGTARMSDLPVSERCAFQ